MSVSIPIVRSWDCLLADKVVIPLRSVEGQRFRVSNGGISCLGVGDVADDWSSLVLAPRIGLVGQGVIVHDVPRVGDTCIGDPLRSKPLLNGVASWDVLVISVANVPEKFVSVLELDSAECSSHADVDAANIIDWVNDVSLGLVLDEQRQAVAVFIVS